jgi:hypothetical protein
MDDEVDPHEAALRRLPEAPSLAPEGLDTLIQVAEHKLAAELRNH